MRRRTPPADFPDEADRLESLDPEVWLTPAEREEIRDMIERGDLAGLRECWSHAMSARLRMAFSDGVLMVPFETVEFWALHDAVHRRRREAGWRYAQLTGKSEAEVASQFGLGWCSNPNISRYTR